MKISACSVHSCADAHRFLRHRLAEGNRRRFENTAARVAFGRFEAPDQPFDNLVGIELRSHFRQRTLPLLPCSSTIFSSGQSRHAVQAVDVLCDQPDEFSFGIQRVDKIMADVRFGVFVLLPAVEAPFPSFDARRLRCSSTPET